MKTIQSISDLALFGAAPAFAAQIHVGRPNIGDRDVLLARINDMLDRRWLTNNGPFVLEFERQVARITGVKHCIAVCNATAGLEICYRALGLTGEVIVPSFTFIATVHALQWMGITPVFCDVDPQTHNLDPDKVEALITPHTSGIVGVHVWGRACDTQSLAYIARRRNLMLAYDAAHAFGCSHLNRMIGGFGAAEVFSFHATKFLNAFEGGAITTNDDQLAARLRLARNFGFQGYDNVTALGINGKMNEASAAMGLTSLESMDAFIAANYRNYRQYERELERVVGVKLLRFAPYNRNNYQYIVLEMDSAADCITRDELVKVLHAENILARRYFHPGCHRMEPYRSLYPDAVQHLPHTEKLAARVLVLPNGTSIDEATVSQICAVIRFAVREGAGIHERLGAAEGSV